MYLVTIDPDGSAEITVGDGPLDDFVDVVERLEKENATHVTVTPAGDGWRTRADCVDRMLYDSGFDVS